MFTPADISGVDVDVARRIIVAARSIAPCLDSLEGERKAEAVAILKGVADELPEPGERRVRAQRIGPSSVDYWDANTWSAEDRSALRSLCTAAPGGLPQGSFPEGGFVGRLWPEKYS